MTLSATPIVYVVDDDADVRDSIQWLLESVGLTVVTCADAQQFLDTYEPGKSGCLVLDVRMPGISGLNLQKRLPKQQIDLPVIVISGHADVDMAVTAMTQGAVTFIEKPFKDQVLIDHLQKALGDDMARRQELARHQALQARLESLTKREKEVMEGVVKGLSNKEIAEKLQVNVKTVEGHRAHMLQKMQASSLSDLIQMAIALKVLKSYTLERTTPI